MDPLKTVVFTRCANKNSLMFRKHLRTCHDNSAFLCIFHFSHVMFLVQEVNCQLQLDEAGFGILRPTRELVPGPAMGSVGSSERTLAQQD